MVYKASLLLTLFFLTGCQTIDYIFFGEGTETVIVKAQKEVPTEKKVEVSDLKKDYYGYPIFQIMLNNQSENFESALYYALKQSENRTQKKRYRLVGWYKNKSTSGTLKHVKNKMIEWGIPSDQIYTQTHKAPKSQNHSQIRLYER